MKINFINEHRGYILSDNGKIYVTNNGGTDWQMQNSNTNAALNDIFFVDDTTGYIVGNNGTLLKTINGGTVGVEKLDQLPKRFLLYQNYPNPFNPTTKIRFEIPKSSLVKLAVYDLLGREVAVLLNKYFNSGIYETEFDASNLSSGVYFYTLKTINYSQTKKLVLIR